jgi:P-type E1-E2 ATPase
MTADSVLALAAAAERASEHPLARAVVAAAHEQALDIPHADEFSSRPGRGVTAIVHGRVIRVGSPALLGEQAADTAHRAQARALVDRLQALGQTAVVVLVNDVPAGVLALADQVRPGARETVAKLAAMTGRTPILLTGDNVGAARRLAGEVGITDVRAGLLPADKVTHVRALQADGEHVVLVGDGVNDAPAMAAAELGVAMGRHGSDLALETANAVVVRDELATLPKVIGLSRRAHRVVKANLAFAAAVITILVIWDIVWILPLPLGVAGHEGSTMVVGLNGLRLLRKAAWRKADALQLTDEPAKVLASDFQQARHP